MHETVSPSLPFWDQCVQELKVRRSRFRIRRHPGSPFIYVREMVAGRKLGEFSLKPKRWCSRDDIEEARDLCIQGPPARHLACPAGSEDRTDWSWLV